MIDREKRTVVTMMAGTGILMGLAVFPRGGQAQISVARDSLAASKKQIDELLVQITLRKTPLGEKFVKETIGREFNLRSKTVATLAPLSRDDQLRLTRTDKNHITKLLRDNKIPLVPAKEDIKRIEIKDVQISERPDREEVSEILLDILLDSFELYDVKEVLKEAIRSNEELNSNLNHLTQSVVGRDWEAVASLLIKIIIIVTGSAFIAQMQNALTRKYGRDAAVKIFKRFLVSLSLKLMPFVGVSLYLVALLLSIKRHAHRFG